MNEEKLVKFKRLVKEIRRDVHGTHFRSKTFRRVGQCRNWIWRNMEVL